MILTIGKETQFTETTQRPANKSFGFGRQSSHMILRRERGCFSLLQGHAGCPSADSKILWVCHVVAFKLLFCSFEKGRAME